MSRSQPLINKEFDCSAVAGCGTPSIVCDSVVSSVFTGILGTFPT